MTYYAFIQNDKINGCGECECLTASVQNIEITEDIFNNISDYIWNGSEVILDPELDEKKLQEAKELKVQENDTARDEALLQGVTYKDVLFDSDTDQKVNLLATVSTMSDKDTITWFGKYNQPLECSKQDLVDIGGLITMLHAFCWNKNSQIKQQISLAKSVSEVEFIEITYECEEIL